MKKIITLCFLYLLICEDSCAFDAGKSSFSIEVNGVNNPYKINSVFVLPNAIVKIVSQSGIAIQNGDVKTEKISPKEWRLIAPQESGVFKVKITDNNKNQIVLNVLVLTPISQKKGEYLNGYRIGSYPSTPLRGNPIYNRPQGLFEVTEDNKNTQLTPHFILSQFVCKQSGGYPKYLIIREQLLVKLEYLLGKVNESGFNIDTFGFISGYRTPFYNASIKNVQYSRHVYGGAADIIIDQDSNGSFDDLNKDGIVDEKDVRIFYDVVENEFNKHSYNKMIGGLGFYRKNSRHNGFIHVDVRGWKARW